MGEPLHESKIIRLAELRAQLAEKFPQPALPPTSRLPLGIKAFDGAQDGLRKGAVTEISGSAAGGSLFLAAALEFAVQNGTYIGLIDGVNSFEPGDWEDAQLAHLLWVMCGGAEAALRATDLLLRDGNLSLLMLDLQLLPLRELRHIPSSTWHRFQRLLEQSSTVLAVLTACPVVESAAVRIRVQSRFRLGAMEQVRNELQALLQTQVLERGAALVEFTRKTA